MIHIVFNEPDVEVFKKAQELDPGLAGEILQIKDDFAVGPIADIYSPDAIVARAQWWREVLQGGDYHGLVDKGDINDEKTFAELTQKLDADPNEIVWIWAAQNKHDVSGYYWLVSRLKEYQGRIFILYLNNLPFINEKGQIFYPEWLSAIPPREFSKARRLLARAITLSEFEVDPDEWVRLQNEGKGVRILEGGKKLVQYDYDYYDADLRQYISADWQKASKVIHHFLSKNKQTTGDAYLLWRLKLIIASGDFDVQGEIKGMKDFEIKSKATAIAETME